MKKDIHPQYKPVEIQMTDGSILRTRACYKNDRVVLDIDSKSHPFFTGRQMLVDTAGRVERFNKRFSKSQSIKDAKGQQ
ncbi:MAG: 50S ribosomal protein L31 [Candidatus Kapabacteria bacterium]|nr:50S ribosomal protein L31 [Candidatus Kapabacteria bacterium]